MSTLAFATSACGWLASGKQQSSVAVMKQRFHEAQVLPREECTHRYRPSQLAAKVQLLREHLCLLLMACCISLCMIQATLQGEPGCVRNCALAASTSLQHSKLGRYQAVLAAVLGTDLPKTRLWVRQQLLSQLLEPARFPFLDPPSTSQRVNLHHVKTHQLPADGAS